MSPLDDVDRVTYRLDQTFVYRYDAPIQRLRHRLRVMPPRQHGPTVLETSRLTISGADVQRRRVRDGAGNTVVRLYRDMEQRAYGAATSDVRALSRLVDK